MPQNLLEPTWMELEATTTSIAPSAAGALSMRYRAQFDALRISSTPMQPMSGQAQDFLLNCFVSRWRGLLPPAVNSPGAYLSERLLPRCLEWRIPIARSLGVFG
jgi:hypothetical protein